MKVFSLALKNSRRGTGRGQGYPFPEYTHQGVNPISGVMVVTMTG